MGNITITNTLTNGTVVDADNLNTNFTDITDVVNGSIDGTNISTSSALTIATLSATTSISTDTIAEKTSATGVTIDGVLIKDSLDGSGIVDKTTAQTLTNKTLTKPAINGTNPTGATYTPATGAQTVALDCAANNMHIVTGHASGTAITFTIANATNNQPFLVSILQGGVVSTITAWFATVRWVSGTTPTLTATINKRDWYGFIRTGTDTYDGFIVGQNL